MIKQTMRMSQTKIALLFHSVLISLLWLLRKFSITDFLPADESYFMSTITVHEEEKFLELLSAFQNASEIGNITYFLSYGSYIGATRHHGMIPWDDDVDVLVDSSDKEKLKTYLAKYFPQFTLQSDKNFFLDSTNSWKLYDPLGGHKYLHRGFMWPFIDIFFFNQNSTHVYDEIGELTMRKQDIFPLKRRPFGLTVNKNLTSEQRIKQILWMPIICKPPPSQYTHVCMSRSYSHNMELQIFLWNQRAINCQQLHNYHSFVNKSRTSKQTLDTMTLVKNKTKITTKMQIREELHIGQQIIYDFYFPIEDEICDGDQSRQLIPFEITKHISKPEKNYPEYFVKGFKFNNFQNREINFSE